MKNTCNPLQALMIEWNATAPYNALHIARLVGTIDKDRWQATINNAIQDLGINEFYSYDQQPRLEILPRGDSVEQQINLELNQPFDDDQIPLRFFLLPAESHRYYLGACYCHWVADSYAMRALVRSLIRRYYAEGVSPELQMFNGDFDKIFQTQLNKRSWLQRSLAFINNYSFYCTAFRTPVNNAADFHCQFNFYTLPEKLLPSLQQHRQLQASTIQDKFIAALAVSLGEYWQEHRSKQKWRWYRAGRNRVTIGTIVDLRSEANENLDHIFGQFLGSYTIKLNNPECMSSKILLNKIHRITERIKKYKRAVRNYRGWDIALKLWRRYAGHPHQARLFNKISPVMAGISNVNLDVCQHTCGQDQVLNYLRVSPVGPLLPIVFTLSTFKGRISLGVTYRTTAYSSEQVDKIVNGFIHYLEDLCFTQQDNSQSPACSHPSPSESSLDL